MASRSAAPLVFLTLVALFAGGHNGGVSAQLDCPPGQVQIQTYTIMPGAGVTYFNVCTTDPCYNNDPCLGGQCSLYVFSDAGGSSYRVNCTCIPPAVVVPPGFDKTIAYPGYVCGIPGKDPCQPNPCKNFGTCQPDTRTNGLIPACSCLPGFFGYNCGDKYPSLCGLPGTPSAPFPARCYFNSDPQGRYVCCDPQGCGRYQADNLTPTCTNSGYVPPNYGASGPSPSPASPPPSPPPSPVVGDQGVCGSGDAALFPTRCWFNADPLHRYVCCDSQGCNGFNPPDFSFPHCANNGYVPPGYGISAAPANPPSGNPPPGPPPSGDQGVCGSGAAQYFPVRCWYNSDPLHRYVCCDSNGCDGFNPPDYLFPHCKSNGFVPSQL